MKMAVGTMALATFLLVACSAHKDRRVRRERPAKKDQKAIRVRQDQKATRVHQGRRVPQAPQACGS
jgi:uncharacterized protein YcfL